MNTDLSNNRPGTAADASIPMVSRHIRRKTGRKAGTSLVEVLIVLVVILIGVFAVIQIFPIGFKSLRNSEARLRADRLARNVTDGLTADASDLPESITFSYYNTGATGNQLTTITDQDPDNLGTYQNDPQNRQYFSDVNKYRYIKNEPIRVPLPTAMGDTGFSGNVGSVHFLTFGPIFMSRTVGTRENAPDYDSDTSIAEYDSYLRVTSEALTAYPYSSYDDSNNSIDASVASRSLRGANTYLIDYGDNDSGARILLAYAASTKRRIYTVTYSYEDTSVTPAVTRSVTQKITIAPNQTSDWINLVDIGGTALPGGKPVVAGSDVVVRDFIRLPYGSAWDPTEPYQYQLASSNVSESANLGVVAFNPTGTNYAASTASGTRPFTALASYAVLDWHILHDDRDVPSGGTAGIASVRTTLPGIRVKGEDFVDFSQTGADRNQIYPGLYPQTAVYHPGDALPDDSISPDLQVFNLNDQSGTARLLTAGDYSKRTGADADKDYWIDRSGRGGTYPAGIIYVNTSADHVIAGSKLRILYKATGDWAVSFQKAASAYRANSADGATRPAVGDAASFAVDYGAGGTYDDDRIYFHRSELNKSVTAVVEYDVNGNTVRLPARQFTIQNVDDTDDAYAYVTVADFAPELTSVSGITGWRVFGNINGASLKTRIIWQDDQNGRNPWRISDLETFVTRQAQ